MEITEYIILGIMILIILAGYKLTSISTDTQIEIDALIEQMTYIGKIIHYTSIGIILLIAAYYAYLIIQKNRPLDTLYNPVVLGMIFVLVVSMFIGEHIDKIANDKNITKTDVKLKNLMTFSTQVLSVGIALSCLFAPSLLGIKLDLSSMIKKVEG